MSFLVVAPIILVGTKKDLRINDVSGNEELVNMENVYRIAEKIGAYTYLECSAKLNEDDRVREVFQTAAQTTLQKKKGDRHSCMY